MEWLLFYRHNGTINLKAAYLHLYPNIKTENWVKWVKICRYFERIQELQPIRSRQVAALTISTAKELIECSG